MSNSLRDYNKFISSIYGDGGLFDFSNKDGYLRDFICYTLNRLQSMFKWEGLPDTIPQRSLELYLMCNGCVGIYEYEGNLYAFRGGLGGESNVYYMPTIYTISNPALNLSVNAKIDKDVTIISNDSMYIGIMPLVRRYGTLMAEAELSIRTAIINTRVTSLVSSDNDNTTKSAEKYFADIDKGKLGVIANPAFFEGIKTQPYAGNSNSNYLTNLIEMIQYIKASFFNEIGLNANYNMKRESINSGESQLNNDALLPLIDDMLRCRQAGIEKVNAMFGTSINVDFASSWKDNQEEIELEHKEMEEGVLSGDETFKSNNAPRTE